MVFRGAVLTVILAMVGLYVSFDGQDKTIKASRKIASLEKNFNFLSLTEIKRLKPQDLKSYLGELASAFEKASSQNSKVFSLDYEEKNYVQLYFKLSILDKAYADSVYCPVRGLMPFKVIEESLCEKVASGMIVKEPALSSFAVEGESNTGGLVGNKLFCPKGQKMCNPALIGFDFSKAKPRLRCLPSYKFSNKNCAKLKTTGDQMKRSLDLLEEANPDFWNEFEEGMNEICFDGPYFKESDEGCRLARNQMNHATSKYRSKLTSDYTILADRLKNSRVKTPYGKACKGFQYEPENEMGLIDHRNFNVPGQKIFISTGVCYRFPSDTIVSKTTKEGKDYYNFMRPGEDEPFQIEVKRPGGRLGLQRFHNFKCGPCNDAKDVSRCLSELQKPASDRVYEKLQAMKTEDSLADCIDAIEKLDEYELVPEIIERVRRTGTDFYESQGIN